jgi:hypothetical protein
MDSTSASSDSIRWRSACDATPSASTCSRARTSASSAASWTRLASSQARRSISAALASAASRIPCTCALADAPTLGGRCICRVSISRASSSRWRSTAMRS